MDTRARYTRCVIRQHLPRHMPVMLIVCPHYRIKNQLSVKLVLGLLGFNTETICDGKHGKLANTKLSDASSPKFWRDGMDAFLLRTNPKILPSTNFIHTTAIVFHHHVPMLNSDLHYRCVRVIRIGNKFANEIQTCAIQPLANG